MSPLSDASGPLDITATFAMIVVLWNLGTEGYMPGLFERTGNAEKDAIIASAEAAYSLCQGIVEACEQLAYVNAGEAADAAGESLVDVVRWL